MKAKKGWASLKNYPEIQYGKGLKKKSRSAIT